MMEVFGQATFFDKGSNGDHDKAWNENAEGV
jgi:hypothetical protein